MGYGLRWLCGSAGKLGSNIIVKMQLTRIKGLELND